jgi:TusA-related sulfurtransferase
MQEITLETKIADLLNNYEGMKDILIDINPKFEKLNNPILRRTIAKVAGVRQAAIVGGMKPMELLNQLREAVGQTVITQKEKIVEEFIEKAPEWITQEPKVSLDANMILDNDQNPLVELHKTLKKLEKGDIVLLLSDFQPEPLIEEFIKKGHQLYCQEVNSKKFLTYIMK